ncbi:hypothetical protein M9H77_27102 [Catharanthus roseus]|uniref:Uncharacterized protein n=1 Tax=Catharanthus roseus TaxID=4058 RepID=A0ACC0ACF0_CATRO|nr:hypothetical protein M9H77_27102 [Catharanthus roseus]
MVYDPIAYSYNRKVKYFIALIRKRIKILILLYNFVYIETPVHSNWWNFHIQGYKWVQTLWVLSDPDPKYRPRSKPRSFGYKIYGSKVDPVGFMIESGYKILTLHAINGYRPARIQDDRSGQQLLKLAFQNRMRCPKNGLPILLQSKAPAKQIKKPDEVRFLPQQIESDDRYTKRNVYFQNRAINTKNRTTSFCIKEENRDIQMLKKDEEPVLLYKSESQSSPQNNG